MKESYREGVANHPGPESCAGGGNTPGEALTGVHIGPAIELRKHESSVPTWWLVGEGNTWVTANREVPHGRCGVEEPGHV